ncbi:ribbon-helix-helix domain-containing protein [Mesorhizobium sp. YR577]|uniref:CopG family ribbon-helix-helix protein n=1 Tax=Mesorhizobium sp. YR577 TaxID=1884373 RepID=UPI0008E63F53|nr:ribbon-helix-helix domain-containing protein [Mesorhizobium sp. YR577]SFT73965.1 Predicted transcriptional regulator [Mesorhizobium sp. YR577]
MATPLSDPIAVRLPADVLEGIDEVAAILDRKRSWIIVRALKNYLAGEGQYLRDLAAARKEAGTGNVVEGDQLLNELTDGLPLYGTIGR